MSFIKFLNERKTPEHGPNGEVIYAVSAYSNGKPSLGDLEKESKLKKSYEHDGVERTIVYRNVSKDTFLVADPFDKRGYIELKPGETYKY